MANTSTRNNALAGVFLIVSLIAAVVISIVLSGMRERLTPMATYTVSFSLGEGAMGLKRGSAVTLGGTRVGRVTGVEVRKDSDSGPGVPLAVDVDVLVRADIQLYDDADIMLVSPLLGSMSSLNITSIGSSGAVADESTFMTGLIAPPSFLAQAGFGPDQSLAVRDIIDRVGVIVARAESMLTVIESDIEPTVEALRSTAENIRNVSENVDTRSAGWFDQLDVTLENFSVASGEVTPLIERLSARTEDVEAMILSVRDGLDVNIPKLNRIMDNVESVTQRIDAETMDLVTEAIREAGAGIEQFSELGVDARALLTEQVPSIRHAMANARLASDQLKLTLVEVRAQPWRLLHRPQTKELREQLVYDSARTYANAVGDLRAASESLEAVAASGDNRSIERETIEHLLRRIDEAFELYERAEREFLQRLSESP